MDKKTLPIRANADHLIILPANPPERTAGGLILPLQIREEHVRDAFYGRVLAVGPEVTGITPHDVVMFDRNEALPLAIPKKGESKKGTLVFYLREDDVLSVWELSTANRLLPGIPKLKDVRELAELMGCLGEVCA